MPLSEYERRVLEEMEAQLQSDDPKLATSMAQAPRAPRRGRIAAGVMVFLAGITLLVVGMIIGQVWLSLVGFAIMFVGVWTAFSTPKSRRPVEAAATPGKAPKAPKRGLADRFEDRWEGRDQP